MAKRIKIRIFPDGRVQAEVQGVKGKACTNYIPILEELLNAQTADSSYTPEYFETESVQAQLDNQEKVTEK